MFQVEAEVNEKVKEGGKWSQRKIEWMEAENDNSARSLEYRKEFLARTRSARLPTAMLFFCCHKCHTRNEKGREKNEKSEKNEEMKSLFFTIFPSKNEG